MTAGSPVFDAWALPPGAPPPGSVEDLAPVPGGGTLRRAALSGAELQALLAELRRAGSRLRDLALSDIVATIGDVGARLARPGDPLRAEALRWLPAFSGLSEPQARHVLDGMALDWTRPRLERLLASEFVDPAVLDGFRPDAARAWPHPGAASDDDADRDADADPDARGGGDSHPAARHLRALGPGLAVHVCAGTVPGVAATSLIRALLVKGPVLLKPGAGDVVLPVLLARALAGAGEVGGVLAGALAVLYWPGGTRSLEEPALAAADLAVVYGGDDTVGALRPLLRPSARLVAYPHRVSLAVLGSAALAPGVVQGVAARLARAVASFDQRGCVSPRQVFLLGADGPAATRFGVELGAGLQREAVELPPGPLEPTEAAAVQQLRATVELRAAAGERLELLRGPDLAWTVVIDAAPSLQASCLARTLHVTPLPDVDALERALEPGAAHLQSVGIAGLAGAESEVVERLARLGATRCVPLDQVAFPPAWWMHDGQGPLRGLVRWVEWVPSAP